MRSPALLRPIVPTLLLSFAAAVLPAQSTVGNQQPTQVKDSSMLKPPSGAKVAIVEWEDLECPACMHAFPIVHEAANHYHIPIVRYDFQILGHVWSHEGSIYARYLQDKVSPELATEYRREVFASQYRMTCASSRRSSSPTTTSRCRSSSTRPGSSAAKWMRTATSASRWA